MKKSYLWTFFVAFAAMLSLSFTPPSAKTDAMVKEWERAKNYTKAYLDAATEATFALKPTPDMRSFGEQMLHLTEANYAFGATLGKPSPYKFGELEKGTLKSKADVTKAVLDGYDFVIAGLKAADDAKLASSVKMFNMDMTVETAINKAFEHQTHHRGQSTVYLRLSGVKPPQEMLF